ncbi:uncharacterized protein TNCV_1608181 [Trichonephila clavipes]|nr:uncharacterized protein TNCV_1608181 [Trichonephila clavipes]
MQTYKLDPCWYFTTPALSWDAMLLHTKVAIELFTDYDMLLFIEKGVRGGISQCCNRYAIANNRYMSNFNPDEEIKYLMYLDANNLYGYAMSKYLPLKDFVWSDKDITEQYILNLSDESDVGYILEVDLEYPSDLHDKHSDFPLAPENKPPPNCKEPRLLTTLEPKTKYVLHYSNLKLYLKLGRKQFNSPPQLENQSQCRRKTTQLGNMNETTHLGSRNETTQLVSRTQLSSRNEQLNFGNRSETTQLVSRTQLSSRNEQLNSALPSTAYNRLQPLIQLPQSIQLVNPEFFKPEAAEILETDFYVDDLVSGASIIDIGKEIQKQLIQLFSCAGMKLHKWSSNSKDMLQELLYEKPRNIILIETKKKFARNVKNPHSKRVVPLTLDGLTDDERYIVRRVQTREFSEDFKKLERSAKVSNNNISWKFIPPRSLNFEGLWESCVKSAKYDLRHVVGNARLTYDELSTVLAQIEAVLNSRPISPLSSETSDYQALTPRHILSGRPLTPFLNQIC